MKIFRIVIAFVCVAALIACASLRPVSVALNEDLANYKYAYIPTTGGVVSGAESIYGGFVSKTVNPCDIITGHFIKEGYVIVQSVEPDLAEQTLIVNYGEVGRRNIAMGLANSIEITVQLLSAATNEIVCEFSGEGIGETESDGIRNAINRCFKELFGE